MGRRDSDLGCESVRIKFVADRERDCLVNPKDLSNRVIAWRGGGLGLFVGGRALFSMECGFARSVTDNRAVWAE
jgi:hypothetical protein